MGTKNIKKIRDWFENIIETKNWIIQVAYLLGLIVLGTIHKLGKQDTDLIIIELLFVIAGELCIINTKDSITRRKVEEISVKQDIEAGRLFRIADFNLNPFFENGRESVFISGMALNGVFHNLQTEITTFLNSGKKMYILIADPKMIYENAKLYFGVSENSEIDEYVKRVIGFQRQTLDIIVHEYRSYFIQGKLKLGLLDTTFSTSLIGYDCMDRDKSKTGYVKKIKASFYQYGCRDVRDEPNILVSSDDSEEWYDFFRDTINKQWEGAKKIFTIDELASLIRNLDEKG